MKIAISGSTGLVGRTLVNYFINNGEEVYSIIRPQSKNAPCKRTIKIDLMSSTIQHETLEGIDDVIHLAGANIAGKRWTEQYKKEILESRVKSTQLMADAIKCLKKPPKLFCSASAIGFYGPADERTVFDESSQAGNDFLAEVCQRWEEAAQGAQSDETRVVRMRFGTILSKDGGALQKMMLPFQLGLGGKLGSGQQMFSWIALSEIPFIVEKIIHDENITGAVNVTAPQALTNAEFTKVFGQAIKRPTAIPVPEFGVKTLFGEMGEALLLNGARVAPKVLLDSGYKFKYAELKDALANVLK